MLCLDVNIGSISLHWNESNQLSQLRWKATPAEPPSQSAQKSLLLTTGMIPKDLVPIIESLREFFDHGCPITEAGRLETVLSCLDMAPWSEFQKKVYLAILSIPHGETRSYAWVAQRIGSPNATRAVGQALRRNPLPVIIPCHRVVSHAGGLGGFMGRMGDDRPEIQLKQRLLEIENNYVNPTFSFVTTTAHDPLQFEVAG